ncbi:FKBP-type peptidyl-prolyl cis-trans isomerase [Erythrobacter alti]|uniref:FKBP-type peptidyl-prolyl cis-trans isomerase n=1 Tax=Erythrobacter alti TaxID=1896145 RepID=UPI0030F49443
MAEVTRVPLQPIAKGSLLKLWLGVLVAVLVAAGVAWAAMPKGLTVETVTAGEGPNPTESSVVFLDYVGKLEDGTEFDRSPESLQMPPEIAAMIPRGVPMPVGDMVPGFSQGLLQTQKGGTYLIEFPGELGYGDTPPPQSDIPANAGLSFEVTVHEILTEEEFQQLAQRVQTIMMQAQMEAQAGESGAQAPAAPPQ